VAQGLAERVVDLVVSALDVDALLGRVDVDALLGRVDVDRLLAGVGIDDLLARVDIDALLARVDMDEFAPDRRLEAADGRASHPVRTSRHRPETNRSQRPSGAANHAPNARRIAGQMADDPTFLQVTMLLAGLCKTVGSAYVGSNPTPATTSEYSP